MNQRPPRVPKDPRRSFTELPARVPPSGDGGLSKLRFSPERKIREEPPSLVAHRLGGEGRGDALLPVRTGEVVHQVRLVEEDVMEGGGLEAPGVLEERLLVGDGAEDAVQTAAASEAASLVRGVNRLDDLLGEG